MDQAYQAKRQTAQARVEQEGARLDVMVGQMLGVQIDVEPADPDPDSEQVANEAF
jgi:hypothetical protein